MNIFSRRPKNTTIHYCKHIYCKDRRRGLGSLDGLPDPTRERKTIAIGSQKQYVADIYNLLCRMCTLDSEANNELELSSFYLPGPPSDYKTVPIFKIPECEYVYSMEEDFGSLHPYFYINSIKKPFFKYEFGEQGCGKVKQNKPLGFLYLWKIQGLPKDISIKLLLWVANLFLKDAQIYQLSPLSSGQKDGGVELTTRWLQNLRDTLMT